MTRISRADDIEFRNDIQEIYSMHRFTNDPNNAVANNIFYQFYNAIYRANSILQEIDGKDFTEEFIDQIRGEALLSAACIIFSWQRSLVMFLCG